MVLVVALVLQYTTHFKRVSFCVKSTKSVSISSEDTDHDGNGFDESVHHYDEILLITLVVIQEITCAGFCLDYECDHMDFS